MPGTMNIEKLLSPRMRMVAGLVPPSRSVCDIGTDHGYVAIYLVKNNIAGQVIAADINKGPLLQAAKNVTAFAAEDRIKLRLSDGFGQIRTGECDTAVIAGMGGETIAAILKNDIGINRFVLQPQSAHMELRSFLCENGYIILREELCREGEKLYAAMLVGRGKSESLSREELEIGPLLIKLRHPLLGEYISYRLHEVECVLSGLKNAQRPGGRKEEYEYLRNKYTEIARDFYEACGDNTLS